ncbi:MAG: membrane dipeptidase [Planctomycetota bacterium]
MPNPPLIFDGHLDLALNALAWERDQTLPLDAIRQREAPGIPGTPGVPDHRGTATVSLPTLQAGGVRLAVATCLARAKPWLPANRPLTRSGDWPSPDMAHAIARGQLAYYQLLESRNQLRILRTAQDLTEHAAQPQNPLGIILTLEGGDAITTPDELHHWHALGLRTLSLAHFGRSPYAHGTPSTDPANSHDTDGPLAPQTADLFAAMHELGMPLDLTHLSDTSLHQALDQFPGRVYASHSSCRALVPQNEHVHPMRMLTDDQIKAIAERDGVIGLPLFNAFLQPGYTESSPKEAVTIVDVAAHARHIANLTGTHRHLALGSDLDGGFGSEHIPAELDSAADLPQLHHALTTAGFTPDEARDILAHNLTRFFAETLPTV